MTVSSRCICTAVADKALVAILESHAQGATYRDPHPWIIAREIFDEATAARERLPLLFATGQPIVFSHWSFVVSLEVRELHPGTWETHCGFETLQPVNPIWEPLDSVTLAPSAEQLHREAVEPVRIHRQMLDDHLIWPYAVCETPAFVSDGHS